MNAFASAVGKAVETVGVARLRTLADGLSRGESSAALRSAVPVAGYAELVDGILAAQAASAVPAPVAAAYLHGVADGYARSAESERIESVWSGPSTHAVPVRSTAKALVDLIAAARAELLLMTYSARPHQPMIEALTTARARGVEVSVVVETLQGAGSALAGSEPAAAFRDVPGVRLWHWPVGERTEKGAKMHAKIAVADASTLLVSSANLTQSGVTGNIEAGVLVRGGEAPRRAAQHVTRLMAAGTLARLYPS